MRIEKLFDNANCNVCKIRLYLCCIVLIFVWLIVAIVIDIKYLDAEYIFIPSYNMVSQEVLEHYHQLSLHREFNLDDLWNDYYEQSLIKNIDIYSVMDASLVDSQMNCYDILYNKYNIIDKNDQFIPKSSINTRIIDVTFYFCEIDILEARLNELSQSVDVFVLIESTLSWNGDNRTNISQLKLINDLRYKKPHLYEKYYLTHRIYHYILDAPKSYDGSGKVYAYNHQFDFFKQKKFKKWINFTVDNDDLIIIGDLDEIPRGMMLYLIKKCDGWINKAKYFPITIDSLVYKYDFGCQFNYRMEFISAASLNFSYKRQFFWQHGGLIRYGQMQLKKKEKIALKDLYFEIEHNISLPSSLSNFSWFDFEQVSILVDKLSKMFDDGHLLSAKWFRPGHEAKHNRIWEILSSKISIKFEQLKLDLSNLKTELESGSLLDDQRLYNGNKDNIIQLIEQMEKNIFNFEKHRQQIILINGGWHLSWFYKNRDTTHNLMTRKADTWINSKFNHENLDCFIKNCVQLDQRKYGQRHYFQIDNNNDKNNNSNYSYNYNYFKYFGIKYPQWTVYEALSDSNSLWHKMFPTTKTNFFVDHKNNNTYQQICTKTMVLYH